MRPGMGRPFKGPQIGVRVEAPLLDRIDALVIALRTPWHEPTRSDVVRACIIEGLPALEQKAGKLVAAELMPHLEPTVKPRKAK
mgnify:CR=1 FL=1